MYRPGRGGGILLAGEIPAPGRGSTVLRFASTYRPLTQLNSMTPPAPGLASPTLRIRRRLYFLRLKTAMPRVLICTSSHPFEPLLLRRLSNSALLRPALTTLYSHFEGAALAAHENSRTDAHPAKRQKYRFRRLKILFV
jgi:hypothetical protein